MNNTLTKKCPKLITSLRSLSKRLAISKIFILFFLGIILSITLITPSKASPIAGSVEGHFLVSGDRIRESENQDQLIKSEPSSSWEVRPSIDYALNDHIFVGGEIGIGWLGSTDQVEQDASRRVTVSTHARLRMDFPLSCALVLEGVLGIGLSTWGEAQGVSSSLGGGRHWGQSVRMNLGLRYLINTKVSALLGSGYVWQEVYDDQSTFSLSAIPISFGIRSAF